MRAPSARLSASLGPFAPEMTRHRVSRRVWKGRAGSMPLPLANRPGGHTALTLSSIVGRGKGCDAAAVPRQVHTLCAHELAQRTSPPYQAHRARLAELPLAQQP
eukprot:scaffold90056_cov29-Tisochrysis_lutea.AAC.2